MRQKLHLVISTDKFYKSIRPQMNHMFINKDECVVTDAHALLIHKCKEIFDEEFIESMPEGNWLIPYDAVKKMNTKGATYLIKGGQIYITLKGDVAVFNIVKDGTDGMTYPQYRQVIPTEYNGQLNAIGLKPDLLYNLSQAIDPDNVGVILQWSDTAHAMSVRAKNSTAENYVAILMPMMID